MTSVTNQCNCSCSSSTFSSSSSSSCIIKREECKVTHIVAEKACSAAGRGTVHEKYASTAMAASREYVYLGANLLRRLDLLPCGRLITARRHSLVKSVVVSDDGTLVVTGHEDHKIRLWKLTKPENSNVFSLSSHHHVATLPSVKDRLLGCLFQSNYIPVRRHHQTLWIQHADIISALALASRVLYSGSWDKTVKVWRLSDLKCVESIAAHDDAVNALVSTEEELDGSFLYTASADGTIKVWRTPAAEKGKHLKVDCLIGHAKRTSVNAIAISRGVLCSGGSDAEIAVWRRPENTKLDESKKHMELACKLKGHARPILSLCFSKCGLLLSGSADHTIRVWQPTSRRTWEGIDASVPCCVLVLRGHGCPVRSLGVSPHAQPQIGGCVVYSVGSDHSMKIWLLSCEPLAEPSPFALDCSIQNDVARST